MSGSAKGSPTALPILIGCASTFILVLGILALPDQQPVVVQSLPPPARQADPAEAPPSQVSGGGLTLTSTSVEFPDDDVEYGQASSAQVMNRNCTACHSANMVLNQPALSGAQWKATVEKMRDAYKATVQEKDVPAIVSYLTTLSAKFAQGRSSGASDSHAARSSASSVSG
jgi:mono/diheme cytochrome c family protein